MPFVKDTKIGVAGRFYTLTPKAIAFCEGLEAIAEKHGIAKEDIPKTLAILAEMERANTKA